MTLEIIVFIGSILFGILLYWRESTANGFYRFFNRLMYSKKLQMSPQDTTGFLYRQKFVLRLVFIGMIFLVAIMIARLLIPIDVATISVFLSSIVGTLLGTYIGGFILRSEKAIDVHSEILERKFNTTIDQGREYVRDLSKRQTEIDDEIEIDLPKDPNQKSARERLKDKGLM